MEKNVNIENAIMCLLLFEDKSKYKQVFNILSIFIDIEYKKK